MGNIKIKYFAIFVFVYILFFVAGNINAQYEEEKAFTFIKEIFDRHDNKLQDFLITELTHYINTFPDKAHSEDAKYLLAKVYEEKGATHKALALFLKMIYLYPDSPKKSEWADLVRQIVAKEKKYKDQKSEILNVIEQQNSERTIEDRYFDYLILLMTLDQPKLNDSFLNSCREFIKLYPDDKKDDQVTLWIAEIYAKKKKNTQAEACFLKFNLLYADSPLLPQAIYKRGALLYEKLNKTDQAIEELNRVVAEYPESSFAADALLLLGTIKEKKLKDYKAANADYRKLADNYSKNPKTIDALFAMAKLNKEKLKDYPIAVAAYNEIVEKDTTGVFGAKALEEIATIYKNNLKDFAKASETYKRIADVYENYEQVADRLYEAGTICEKKLKNNQKAIEYYQMILDKYPTHKRAGDAKKRIEKLQKN